MSDKGVKWEIVIEGKGFPQFSSTVTLLRLDQGLNLLFDLGSPYDSYFLIEKLKDLKLGPDDITHVISSHWHIDHLGGITLFPKAVVIGSAETLEIQKQLYEAVSEAERHDNSVQALTEILMEHLISLTFTKDHLNLAKLHAMANLTIRNASLVKEFIRKYEDGKFHQVSAEQTTLFKALQILKVDCHTEGDLIASFAGTDGEEVFIVGDVVTGMENGKAKEDFPAVIGRKAKGKERLIIPGHGNVFAIGS